MFIDASALTAIVSSEQEADAFLTVLEAGPDQTLTSAVAIYESSLAIARRNGVPVSKARDLLEAFLRGYEVAVVPIDAETARLAIDAHLRYGKGTGHPAQLNMGDCFAYACARAHGARLLYKGEDFARTDLA
ncbi:type II toxin-antitoxin system VapC family toxin [Methylopila musalis]|uniref:Ribonuclease VapC n=1 Tax=Methylopila musalis TaxID=1134781 RepID=A0ABW3Z732_9HYPH